eukprot:1147902-Pelagomonas_calceolata.AAC.1
MPPQIQVCQTIQRKQEFTTRCDGQQKLVLDLRLMSAWRTFLKIIAGMLGRCSFQSGKSVGIRARKNERKKERKKERQTTLAKSGQGQNLNSTK